MKIFQRVVSPVEAAAYLDNNEGNRKLRPTHVDFLTRVILAGQWRVTHQGIAISKSGRLLDGQHRLRAICKANMAVPMMVATEVDDDLFKAMDAGVVPRSIAELLGTERRATAWATTMLRLMLLNNKVQSHEVELVLDAFGKEVENISEFAKARSGKRTSSSPICAAAMIRLAEVRNTEMLPEVVNLVRRGIMGDLSGAPPVTISFFKQITEAAARNGGTSTAATFARAWVAFSPANAGIQRIQINDPWSKVAEARTVFHKATAGVFE